VNPPEFLRPTALTLMYAERQGIKAHSTRFGRMGLTGLGASRRTRADEVVSGRPWGPFVNDP